MLFEELKIHLLRGLVVIFGILMCTHGLYAVGHGAVPTGHTAQAPVAGAPQVQERCCHVTTPPADSHTAAQASAKCRARSSVSKGRRGEETAVRWRPETLTLTRCAVCSLPVLSSLGSEEGRRLQSTASSWNLKGSFQVSQEPPKGT